MNADPLTLQKQLDGAMEFGLDRGLFGLLERSARFHGHICPGLAIGINASRVALHRWERATDEELVAVVENDACCVDAIQELLGCTFGKGNLIFRDHGKMAFTFFRRGEDRGIRLSLRRSDEERDPAEEDLISRMRSGEATDVEKDRFRKLWIKRAVDVLGKGEDLFDIESVSGPPPGRARIHRNLICFRCGEQVSEHRSVRSGDEILCIPCSGGSK